jgi:serine/threonine protein phosphatase PrpC
MSFEDTLRRMMGRGRVEENKKESGEPGSLQGLPVTYASIHEKGVSGGEFEKEKLSIGNFEVDGYQALLLNQKTGQDSFGISPDRRTFSVTDGLAGGGKSSGAMARFISHELCKDNESWKLALTKEGISSLVATYLQRANELSKQDVDGLTTLSICRVEEDGSVTLINIGDSPIYVQTEEGIISIGDDGLNDYGTKAIGVTDKAEINDFDISHSVRRIEKAETVVIASDWFSDNYQSVTAEYNERWITNFEDKQRQGAVTNSIEGNEYALRIACRGRYKNFDPLFFKDKTPEELEKLSRENFTKKPDDITIIMVDPKKILEK